MQLRYCKYHAACDGNLNASLKDQGHLSRLSLELWFCGLGVSWCGWLLIGTDRVEGVEEALQTLPIRKFVVT